MSGINPNYKGCAFCGQEECDCPYTGKEIPGCEMCEGRGVVRDRAGDIRDCPVCDNPEGK